MYDKRRRSLVMGHTHRIASYYRTDLNGQHAAYENGCLCDLQPSYVKAPDWQSGFSVAWLSPEHMIVQQIPIVNGMALYAGRKYTV